MEVFDVLKFKETSRTHFMLELHFKLFVENINHDFLLWWLLNGFLLKVDSELQDIEKRKKSLFLCCQMSDILT